MSATSQPIAPEFFLQVIRDFELEQLHAEAARLQLSLYHLRRSQIQLEEFRDDPVCRDAIEDNEVVIKNQEDRVDLIRLEVERRGFSMEHGGRSVHEETLVNGNAGTGPEENLGPEVVMGGTGEEEAGLGATSTPGNGIATEEGTVASASVGEEGRGGGEREGIFL